MTKLVIVLTFNNIMGSHDQKINKEWVQKIIPETKRFYDIPLGNKNVILIGSTTFLKATTKERYLDVFAKYYQIIVISHRTKNELILQNENLKKINNWKVSSDLKFILQKYYQNKKQNLFILGGLKIYDQIINNIDQIIVLRTNHYIFQVPYKFNLDFKKKHKVCEKKFSNFTEEIWK